MFTNNTECMPGRLGNHFFRNIYFDYISRKHNIKFKYGYFNEFKKLGINLFVDGKNTFQESIIINDRNFMEFINNDIIINKNFEFVEDSYFQTKEFTHFIKKYFDEDNLYENIINNNIFKNRYNNNDDVYIHIRIGDVPNFTPSFSYYDDCLKNINFENGYISSDTIDSKICSDLINKYNLKIINFNDIETIMFSSTCKNIILSNGSFSWMIGFFGIYSNIFYPNPELKKKWHGDIFVFENWKKIDYID